MRFSFKVFVIFTSITINSFATSEGHFDLHLSDSSIIKNKQFKGANVKLTIKANFACNYLVEVSGPKIHYRIWEKAKKFGMWMKSEELITQKIPSYQLIHTDLNISQIQKFPKDLLIDIFGTKVSFLNQANFAHEQTSKAISSLFQNQKDSMYYFHLFNQKGLHLQDTIDIPFTATTANGDYKVNIYLIDKKHHKKIYTKSAIISIENNAFYDKFAKWTNNWPNLYIILSIAITFLLGWSVNLLLRK